MKINAVKSNINQNKQINNNKSKNNQTQNNLSFKASYKLLYDATDVISGKEISLSHPVLKKTLDFLLPKIRMLDDNLHFDISGTGKFPFFGTDKYGLKFDMSVIDPKKLKFDILNDCKKFITLKTETIRDLRNNTKGMSDLLTLPRRFGELHNPNGQSEFMYSRSLYKRILKEIDDLPKNQLESTYGYKSEDGNYVLLHDCFKEYRPKFKCYAGLEY